MRDESLVGYWKLAGDARDASGNENHGEPHGVDLSAPGWDGGPDSSAGFDGRSSVITVPDSRSLRLGSGDFTITARVHLDAQVDDAIGDITNKYDPESRRGFNLDIKRHAGVTTSQSNDRNLHFGIDSGVLDEAWTDCGRPGNAVQVSGMAVHGG